MKRLLLTLITLTLTLTVYAQDDPLTFAALDGDTLKIFTYADGTLTETDTVATLDPLYDFNWSPDGRFLAYIHLTERYNEQFETTEHVTVLEVYDTERGESRLITAERRFWESFPIAFTGDGRLAVPVDTGKIGEEEPFTGLWMDVLAVNPATGAADMRGRLNHLPGCGGGWTFPVNGRVDGERTRNDLIMTPFGVVFSAICNGVNTAVYDAATGSGRLLDDNPTSRSMHRPALDMSRSRVVGMSGDGLVVVDLETETTTVHATNADPDYVIFGEGDVVYYSATERVGNLLDGVPNADLSFGLSELPLYAVSLHRYDLQTGADETLYETDAAFIPNMQLTPDGETLVFSQIANGEGWLAARGADDFATFDVNAQRQIELESVTVTLHALSLNDGTVQTIADGLVRFRLRP